MSTYKGYEKIPLSFTNLKSIPTSKWIVTEKVHGSCFCFVYDVKNKNISYAKRNKTIKDDEYFFGFRDILPELEPKIIKLCNNLLKIINTNPNFVFVYGELFGGLYPNIESKYKPVQSGIYYSPKLHFYAFDISYMSHLNKEIYLDYDISLKLFKDNDIFHAEPLFIYNSFEKAIEHKIDFNSTIPEKLGLSEVPNNKAEGVVIRSSKQHFLLKIKIKEFSESKYDDNHYDEEFDILGKYKNMAEKHITINRLNNAISKVGELNDDNKDEIYELFVDDILSEINGFHIFGLREWLLERITLSYQ